MVKSPANNIRAGDMIMRSENETRRAEMPARIAGRVLVISGMAAQQFNA